MANQTDTIASKNDFEKGRSVVADYTAKCTQIVNDIDNIIATLTADGNGFNGDAAEGYKEFYNQIKPALTSQLVTEPKSLMKSIEEILTSIETALIGEMDPSLGEANRDAAPAASAATE